MLEPAHALSRCPARPESRGIVSNHTHIVLNDPGDAARRDMNELIVLPCELPDKK